MGAAAQQGASQEVRYWQLGERFEDELGKEELVRIRNAAVCRLG